MSIFDFLANSSRVKEMISRFRESLKNEVVEGSAGGGMVMVRMNGAMEVQSVTVDPEVMVGGDAEMLGDLIAAALAQAIERAKELVGQKVGDMGFGVDPSLFTS